jgi:hypothetical protein
MRTNSFSAFGSLIVLEVGMYLQVIATTCPHSSLRHYGQIELQEKIYMTDERVNIQRRDRKIGAMVKALAVKFLALNLSKGQPKNS